MQRKPTKGLQFVSTLDKLFRIQQMMKLTLNSVDIAIIHDRLYRSWWEITIEGNNGRRVLFEMREYLKTRQTINGLQTVGEDKKKLPLRLSWYPQWTYLQLLQLVFHGYRWPCCKQRSSGQVLQAHQYASQSPSFYRQEDVRTRHGQQSWSEPRTNWEIWLPWHDERLQRCCVRHHLESSLLVQERLNAWRGLHSYWLVLVRLYLQLPNRSRRR